TAAGPAGATQEPSAEPAPEWPPREEVRVRPASSPIEVDGVLDEPAWADAAVVAITHEWLPRDNAQPPVATDCLVTFDDSRLYVAFRALDPRPSEIRAYLADRDTAFEDDAVGFYIDTFNDRRRAYHFRANPLGVQLDATVSDVGDSEDYSWDAIWASAGRITAEGYTVEMAIPFEQLRFPRAAGEQSWGFLARRNYPRSVFHDLRSTYEDKSLDCLVCQFDTATGFTGMDPGHNVEVVPTVTAGYTEARPDPEARFETVDDEVEAGVSARWGITPNVALNATVNPDFSQVEADAAQLDVNERFALFFPEKRPFFLEGADFFATPLRAVFTRTVADPTFGVKLTGKEGPHAFGVFAAEDRLNNLIFPGPELSDFVSLDEDVLSAVLRYRRDMGRRSTLGVLFTGRDADDYENHVLGLDGTVRLSDSDTLRFQALGSDTLYPRAVAADFGQPTGSFQDAAWQADYSHADREWFWLLRAGARGEDFRADSGFMPQVGFREAIGVVERTFWGRPDAWYSRFLVQLDYTHRETEDGRRLEDGANLVFTYEGPLQSTVIWGIRPNRESFLGETFNDLRSDVRVTLRPSGRVGLGLFVRGGETIDFVNVRQAEFWHVQPTVEFRIGRRVEGRLQHLWQEFSVPGGGRFLEANLSQGTLVYHFNVRAFFRAILQYRDVERDLALYTTPNLPPPEEEEELFSQLLFSYKLNPETVLFLGYSDFHEGAQGIDLTQRRRTVFLKLGYAFLW
ncbi:MAG TPA: DUF5916 domain-containing protein, partial [Thermoanaerobaculia bacterium]